MRDYTKEKHNKPYTQNPQYGVLFGSMTAMVVCQQGTLYIKFIPLLRGLHSPSYSIITATILTLYTKWNSTLRITRNNKPIKILNKIPHIFLDVLFYGLNWKLVLSKCNPTPWGCNSFRIILQCCHCKHANISRFFKHKWIHILPIC